MNEKKDYILIDEGKNQHIEWSDTLREENDKIQYHEIIYIKDKSISILGENESEVWIDIDKKNLNNKTINDFEKLLKSYEKNERFDKFKEYLKENKIKFEKGDWQSFDSNTFNQTTKTTKLNSNDLQKAIKEGTALADLSKLWKLKLKFEEHKKKLSADELANYKKSELEEKVDREMKGLNQKAFPKKGD